MDAAKREKILKLKKALIEYLGGNGRYYSELSRLEQSVEDLTQALNTRLDQMLCVEEVPDPARQESPRDRLADRLFETATKLTQRGRVDADIADEFDGVLNALDVAADLKRQSETVKDGAETAAIRHKRSKL